VVTDSILTGKELLNGLTEIAWRAAESILQVPTGGLELQQKPDSSPVTAADKASEHLILAELSRFTPDIDVVSEEATGNAAVTGLGRHFFLIDPLDGTREFLAGRDEYTVNIALVEDEVPVLGIIAAPKRGAIWRGQIGHGAERLIPRSGTPAATWSRTTITTHPWSDIEPRVLLSRSHLDSATDAYVNRLPHAQRMSCGSALKFCLLAQGDADVYPRLAPTSEWDIAAGHALLMAAGGAIRRPDGGELRYGCSGFRVPGFVAFGDIHHPPP
jgi:3'(2'), 5'-bisphosphate nucleotidase